MALARAFSQKFWPTAGDVDDCWCLASIQAANASAPWLALPNVTAFRSAAGKPDVQGVPNGGTATDMAAGIKGSFPSIASMVELMAGWTWAAFLAKLNAGHPAALIVVSAKLPAGEHFGFEGVHAISACVSAGVIRYVNPLQPPHAYSLTITEAELQAAVLAYEGSVHGVLLPTDAEALTAHPLYLQTIGVGRRAEWDRQFSVPASGATVKPLARP